MAVAGTLTYKTTLDTSGVKKAGSTVKSIVAGLGITKLISTAMNTIKSSTDDAIKRLDTLNNFPKVMSNLGISAESSSKAIKKMSDKLAGLPTTLDQGAMAVQRFTSKNGNVQKSTDIFLALNNAILAGGASAETQATALEQISQAYAKGKPDMMEWRSMLTAMPAQLNQVADAMGYGKNGADKLGEALRKGDVSMDKFMATIVKLNKEGTKGFQSFEQQAKNSTGGIATSITVAKTQIVKGVTDILDSLNKSFENTKFGSLGGFVSEIGKKVKEALDQISKLISGEMSFKEFSNVGIKSILNIMNGLNKKLPDLINMAGDIIKDFVSAINENLSELFKSGVEIASTLISSISDQLPKLIPELTETLVQVFLAITDESNLDKLSEAGANMVYKLIEGIIKAIPKLVSNTKFLTKAIISTLSGGQSLLMKAGFSIMKALIIGFVKSLPDLGNAIVEAVQSIFDKIMEFIGQAINIGSAIIDTIKPIIEGILNTIIELIKTGIGMLLEFLAGVWEQIVEFFTTTLPNMIVTAINWLIDYFKKLPNRIAYFIGYVLGLIIKFGADLFKWATTEIPKIINSIIKFFQELPSKIWNFLTTVINNVVKWGASMLSKGIEVGRNFINAVVNFIKELPGKVWSFLTNVISKVISWGSDLANKGKKGAKDLFDGIVNVIKELPGKMLDLGKDIVKGLWNGIKGLKDWVIDKVKGLGGSIVKGLKNALGIKSPSKVMRDEVGQWIPKGLAVGIEMNADSIKKSLDDMYQEMNRTIKVENAKLNFDVTSNNAYNRALQLPAMIDLSANFEGTVPVELNLDGEKIYDNQQKISLRKSIQYGGV